MNKKELMQLLRGASDEDFFEVTASALAKQTNECKRLTDALEQAQAKNIEISNCCSDYRLENERLSIMFEDAQSEIKTHKKWAEAMINDPNSKAYTDLRQRITLLESTLKSIQKQSGDWCQGAGKDGAAFTMKGIWDQCNEVLGFYGESGNETSEDRCKRTGHVMGATNECIFCDAFTPQSKSQERRITAQTTNELPVSTDVGSLDGEDKQND